MAKSTFLEILSGYELPDGTDSQGKRFASKHITGSISRVTNQSRTMRRLSAFFTKVANLFTFTASRTYGMFLLGFGLLTLLLHFAKDYMNVYESIPMHVLVIGMSFALLSIPFLSTDEPLSYAVQDFPLTDFILFEFFCFQPVHRRRTKEASIPGVVGLILGLMCAILGAVVPIWYVVMALVFITYLCLSFISPEFSLFMTFLVIPYLSLVPKHSDIILSALVLVTVVSFARKVASGKRVWFVEQYDLALALMLVFVLISGVFVKGIESFTSSIVVIVLSSGYVLTGSLVTNRRLADSVIKAMIISSVPISLFAVVEYAIALFGGKLDIFYGARATFGSPDVLAIFLLVSGASSLYFVFARRHTGTKLLYAGLLLLTLLALLATLRAWVIVAIAIGVATYFSLRVKRGAGIIVGTLAFLPYTVLMLPGEWLMAISKLSIFEGGVYEEAIRVWIRSRRMAFDHIFAGVGMGADSFVTEYFNYADGRVPNNSHNFLLQILCEAGIFALVAFSLIFLIRLRHRTIYVP